MILAIDQGTTSTRAIAFEVTPQAGRSPIGHKNGGAFSAVAVSQIELAQHFPQSGWVEHDAAEIWRATLQTCREVVRKAGGVGRFAAVGITNQRETSVLWDAATGEPLHRAIVWQDRRTADVTTRLAAEGHEAEVQAATGLILDPYFSASKYAWLLDAVPGAYGWIGNGPANGQPGISLHNPAYDFNDDNIGCGSKFWDRLARRYFEQPAA